jgi:uncharacterized membrane protein YphA (DoxX/SURF4 family)
MLKNLIFKSLKYIIPLVWLANGLFCKVLNLVPRHEEIVARILGDSFSQPLTILIGISEIIMTVWILSGIKPKLNAYAQITIVISMNIIEFIFASDLLMWGKLNSIFAFMFAALVFVNHRYYKNEIPERK